MLLRLRLLIALQDILKKEDGLYIKYAMGSMLNMRYQVRAWPVYAIQLQYHCSATVVALSLLLGVALP